VNSIAQKSAVGNAYLSGGKPAKTERRKISAAGVVAPALTGFLLDRTGKFLAPLAITAAVLVAGALSWVFVVGRVEEVSWSRSSASALIFTTALPPQRISYSCPTA
jgi:hypothetical protein